MCGECIRARIKNLKQGRGLQNSQSNVVAPAAIPSNPNYEQTTVVESNGGITVTIKNKKGIVQ